MKIHLILYGVILLGLSACEDYDIQLPDYERKLVVEGFIEQNQFPVVYLSYSSDYYDAIDSATFLDFVEGSARVKVSDGENEEILIRFSNDNSFPIFSYEGRNLRGEVGKTYYLEVISRGDTVTAQTTIPEPVDFDSLWFQLADGEDSLGNIWGKFSDDPFRDNYYRVFTQTLSVDKKYIPVYQSVVGDRSFNGETFSFALLKGTESITEPNLEEDIFYRRGDTVNIKLTTMDKIHFDFWRTLERELYLALSPFSSSGNEIITNMHSANGEALGVWGGYGASYHRVIIE